VQVPAAVVSLISFTVVTVEPQQVSEAVGAVKLGVAGHWMVVLLPWPPIVKPLQAGFSAIKMAAHMWLALIVADPVPVEPAAVFGAHAPPVVALPFATSPNNSLRGPGDVVEKFVMVTFSCDAANIRTAALLDCVVIAVTPEIVALQPVIHVV
jgi:hypothetical protein